ncbi:DEAD/DEAH box helicase [Candidatus Gracilibacteria bacterium]|nr:DEAD/DEAH box helicase [Candidatus Gracilibacteria bacterium]
MDKEEYLLYIEKSIKEINDSYLFGNWRKQLTAKRLGSEFNKTYNEEKLWNQLLYLTTNSCTLLLEGFNEDLTIEVLKNCGKTYEDLAEISEEYDKDFCLILSALCYDLSGYQANAYCLIKKLTSEYNFESTDENINLELDNYIIKHIQLILLKNIPKAQTLINNNNNIGFYQVNLAFKSIYENILDGNESDIIGNLDQSYKYFLKDYNIPISLLLLLLKTRFHKYLERSIWKNLNYSDEIKKNPIWQKYIKLLTNDIYDNNKLKDINKKRSIFELWISQLRAIEAGLLTEDKNFIIQMPTSAGKTFIAEISILNYLLKFPGKKCIYIAPFKALTNEKEEELNKNLGKLGFSVSTLSGSYEIDEYQNVLVEESDVLITTPEKIDLLFRINKNYFDNISYIVIDEGHLVSEISTRASLLEFLIIRLKIKFNNIKILFISAVMPSINAEQYSAWLNTGDRGNVIRALKNKTAGSEEQWEPTQKIIGIFSWQGEKGRIDFNEIISEDEKTKEKNNAFIQGIINVNKYGRKKFPNKKDDGQTIVELCNYFNSIGGGTLIFTLIPSRALSIAKKFIYYNELIGNSSIIQTESYFHSKNLFGEDHIVTKVLGIGVGIHFGDLPEILRKSIENDFRLGNLKSIISTNTISQGINLPIKNIIVHSVLIDSDDFKLKINQNDFKNLIGRAGRAGMETEGKIIFLDKEKYNKVKGELVPANSLFFNVLKSFINKRISDTTFNNYLNLLSESYLFDLLIEESIPQDELILKIIDNSLFKVQIEESNIDTSIISSGLNKVYNRITEKVSSDKLEVYGMTGFSLNTNDIIFNEINDNFAKYKEFLDNDNYFGLLKSIFDFFSKNKENLVEIQFESNIGDYSFYYDILEKWINGISYNELRDERKKIDNSTNKNDPIINLFKLISDGFKYKFSWGISAFITLLAFVLNKKIQDFPGNIKNLVGYMKYGTNNPFICIARSIGIGSNQVADILLKKYKITGGSDSYNDFIIYISSINYELINSLSISEYEKQNINNTSLKLRPRKNSGEENKIFRIVGTYYDITRKEESLKILVGNILQIERELKNEYDPYAILVKNNNIILGYIPRNLAKDICLDIDLNISNYQIKVTRIEEGKGFNKIYGKLI